MSSSIDPNSGFCSQTKTFHSLRPHVTLPPPSLPLSAFAFAFPDTSPPPPLPSHPAFIDSATSAILPYPQLLTRINSLSSSLQTRYSLTGNTTASVISPPNLHIPVIYLSLLRLGIAVSPSNPTSSPSEISRHLELARPSVIFTTSSNLHKLQTEVRVILIDSPLFLSLLDSPVDVTLPLPRIEQWDPAAVLFSSGTTGGVKGAVLTHRSLISGLAPYAGERTAPPSVSMVTVPLFHSFGFFSVVRTVVSRETAVIMTERFDVGRVMGEVERFRVSSLLVAPPALLAMVRFAENGGGVGGALKSLRAVIFGGAPTGRDLLRRFREKCPDVLLAQGYGLTESTAICRIIDPEESRRLGTVGRLVPSCEAKIVDPSTGIALEPCSQGELWFKGPNIMMGYIGDKEATSATLNSEGWLKTGDLGYIDGDGFIFVVDRLKELIKYKGYQVPPAELEHLLQMHTDIIEAAVIPYPDEEVGEIPMAFVVRKPGSTLSAVEIMDFVAKQVAPYKKIRRVSFTNSIPKNAAGKIMRKDLINIASTKLNPKL